MQLRYCIDYLSIAAAQRNTRQLKFTSMQYGNAVVGAEMKIWPLQLLYRNTAAVDY